LFSSLSKDGTAGTKFRNEQVRSMIGIVLVTHGRLAAEFRKSSSTKFKTQKAMERGRRPDWLSHGD